MSFSHPSCAAIVIVKWQKSTIMEKKSIVFSIAHCSNNECGITIDCDINGVRNIYILLENMIKKER
jgi:hypothetical protein